MNNFKRKTGICRERAAHCNKSLRNKTTSLKFWCAKWDRSIAGLTAVFAFAILLSLVIYGIFDKRIYDGVSDSSSITSSGNFIAEQKLPNIQPYTSRSADCSGSELRFTGDSSNLIEYINEALGRQEVCNRLVLSEVTFPNERISKGWLGGIPSVFESMQIENSVVDDMDDDAFSGDPFKKLNYLSFRMSLRMVKRDWFSDTIIDKLELDFSDKSRITIESESLNQISGTLESLQLVGEIKSAEILVNLTGSRGAGLPYLRTLYLNNNNFINITDECFTNVKAVESLALYSSKLERIDAKAFAKLNSLSMLKLNDNSLTYLPSGIFDSISTKKAIFISNNRFNCNCNLVWFRDFFTDHRGLFADYFYCFGGTDYTKVDFCDENSTSTKRPTTIESSTPTSTLSSTESSTAKSSTSTTTDVSTKSASEPAVSTTEKPLEDLVAIRCEEFPTKPDVNEGSVIKTKLLQNGLVEMTFLQIGDTPDYKITVSNYNSNVDLTKFYLLVTNAQNRSDYFCSINIFETYLCLQHATTYTFCLIGEDESSTTISPYDCTSLRVPEDWDHSSWIPNKDMFLILGSAIGAALLAIFSSGLIVFYCIRQHPNLIKGNKRVIIVESRAADAIVMPKNCDRVGYRTPSVHYEPTMSLNSYSDGYLTPKIYEKITSRPGLRTISEQSSMRRTPYAYSGTPHRIRRSQIRRRMRLDDLQRFQEEELYEAPPPPLPPNHPLGWMHPYYSQV